MKRTATIITLAVILTCAVHLSAGYYEQGRRYYIRKNYDKAKEMFLKAAESNTAGDAYYFLGEIEKLQGNYHEAEEYYKTAITKKNISRQYLINSYWNAILMAEQRNDYEAVVSICRSMWIRTREAKARQKIDSLINKLLWTDNSDAIDRYNEGINLKKRGKTKEALEKFQSSLSLDSSFLAPKFEIGMMAYNSGDVDQASRSLGDITARIPFYAELSLVLGDIEFNRHDYRSAIDLFSKSLEYGFIESSAEYRILIKRGTSYYNISDFQSAEKDIEAALRYNPSSADALLLMSAVKIKMEKYDDALKTLQRAESLNPDNPEILYQLGSVYYKENDPRYAAHFDALFSLVGKKKDYPSKYEKVFLILAKHHFENKNYGHTVAILKTVDTGSQSYENRLLLAKALFNLKEYDNAIDQFEKISLGEEDKFTLCKSYALSGRREKAKALLAEIVTTGDFLTRAQRDPVLSSLVKEMDEDGVRKSEPPKKESGDGARNKTDEKKNTRDERPADRGADSD
ncbi:MAG: hypothetical protein A2176_01900 [Spirochaetes bacterium RBG_13_51_14]|nr:MAG: hypothetical protein A2176_01900 [Spirochaetes bacterium RBG_13_51_14]